MSLIVSGKIKTIREANQIVQQHFSNFPTPSWPGQLLPSLYSSKMFSGQSDQKKYELYRDLWIQYETYKNLFFGTLKHIDKALPKPKRGTSTDKISRYLEENGLGKLLFCDREFELEMEISCPDGLRKPIPGLHEQSRKFLIHPEILENKHKPKNLKKKRTFLACRTFSNLVYRSICKKNKSDQWNIEWLVSAFENLYGPAGSTCKEISLFFPVFWQTGPIKKSNALVKQFTLISEKTHKIPYFNYVVDRRFFELLRAFLESHFKSKITMGEALQHIPTALTQFLILDTRKFSSIEKEYRSIREFYPQVISTQESFYKQVLKRDLNILPK